MVRSYNLFIFLNTFAHVLSTNTFIAGHQDFRNFYPDISIVLSLSSLYCADKVFPQIQNQYRVAAFHAICILRQRLH